jgi:UDP-N-acetylmuramoyl-tripeptide--D-alanyl-D-alanine ligase
MRLSELSLIVSGEWQGEDVECATGPFAEKTVEAVGQGAKYFSRQEKRIATLQVELSQPLALLVKGSRSQHMERVIEAFCARSATCC